MSHARIACLEPRACTFDKVRLAIETILEESLLKRIGLLVVFEHLERLVDRYVEQVLQRAPDHSDRHFGLKVGIDQVPQVLHVLRHRVILAVHEAEQK